jgi:isopentenyl-diphosphate Delta-isomerase
MSERKKAHIDLAFKSQTGKEDIDRRFYYEPIMKAHPEGINKVFHLAGKSLKVPLWVSSMTGGTQLAASINRNLAKVCKEYGMGMGLGSCRIILNDDTHLNDFDVRSDIGDDLPLFANIGIAQLEQLIESGKTGKLDDLIAKLRADGIIIHVNPIQEWFQPEGDRLKKPPIQSIEAFLNKARYPVIVKEVGQGMGYRSLKALLELPLEAVEFAAFGGTNFARLELLRSKAMVNEFYEPLSKVGHDAVEMLEMVNQIVLEGKHKSKSVIISGGIKNYLDGYYLIQKSTLPAIYGQASGFLRYARESYEDLAKYVDLQVKGLELAFAFLSIKS